MVTSDFATRRFMCSQELRGKLFILKTSSHPAIPFIKPAACMAKKGVWQVLMDAESRCVNMHIAISAYVFYMF